MDFPAQPNLVASANKAPRGSRDKEHREKESVNGLQASSMFLL